MINNEAAIMKIKCFLSDNIEARFFDRNNEIHELQLCNRYEFSLVKHKIYEI